MTPSVSLLAPWCKPRGSIICLGWVWLVAFFPAAMSGQEKIMPAPVILQQLRAFAEMGSVLYVAAHPDDENTQLITYLARGRNYRTAYLSLTRGDGGQNVLGSEFGEELGVIRTQELLAARRLDGGRQFFTRAMDFGFSKNYRETLEIWDHQQVVADIVRVIRTFRPDVVVNRFSTQAGGTHGHHTASAVLSLEAFKLAGDPRAFPDQLTHLTIWQPKRIFVNGRGGNSGPGTVQMTIAGNDPESGEPFGNIAGRSRAMHKTQGFGNFGGGGGGVRTESFQLLAGDPVTNDILDGVERTWTRYSGGAEIARLSEEVILHFNPEAPDESVAGLLKLRALVSRLPPDPVVIEKEKQLGQILQSCLGLEVDTAIMQAEVTPGEKLTLQHSITLRSHIPVRWVATRYPASKGAFPAPQVDLLYNETVRRDQIVPLPGGAPLTQPYWMGEEPDKGMFRVADASLIGSPESPCAFPVEQVFEVDGQNLVVSGEPLQSGTRQRLEVIPPVSLNFIAGVQLFAPGSRRSVEIEITAARTNVSGRLQLGAPAGWQIVPASQSFQLSRAGDKKRFLFDVTAPPKSDCAAITASARIGESVYDRKRIEISYKHIPHLLLQPPAVLKALSLDLAIRGKKVGYVPGAGDSVAAGLEQMGYAVTLLSGLDLTTNRLKFFDTVVIGIRAFNVRTDLVPQLPSLFDYVHSGGTVIAQYNRPGGDLKTEQLAPYRLHLSNDRITDETAAMNFLVPDHPVLNKPNKITPADFSGWVQERGIYFPDQWDDHFIPILACSDPGEAPLQGSLLVSQFGQGNFIYTGLVFFRELPAGVPGAYRLLANLVSLGK